VDGLVMRTAGWNYKSVMDNAVFHIAVKSGLPVIDRAKVCNFEQPRFEP
jgi:hypothetical protein